LPPASLRSAGMVGFYGTGDIFAIADALLGLPDDALGGVFDGNPARHGTLVRGLPVRPPAEAAASSCACVVLCTQAAEAAMRRALTDAGFRGRIIGFNEILEAVCDEASDRQGVHRLVGAHGAE
ncbi:hypothetical protein, partial [Azospirillum isscasi]